MKRQFQIISIATMMLGGCAAGPIPTARPDAKVDQLAAKRAEKAAVWLKVMLQRRDAKEPLTPTFMSQLIDAARTCADAWADTTTDPAKKAAAYRAYRDVCQGQIDEINGTICGDPSPVVMSQLRFAVADAEYKAAVWEGN